MNFRFFHNFSLWKCLTAVISITLTALCFLIVHLYGRELLITFENYVFALVAITAAFATVVGIEKQILEQARAQQAVHDRKLRSNKIGLLFPLNQAYLEMGNSMKQVARSHQRFPIEWAAFQNLITSISLCIEFENEENATVLAKICERIQVLNARYQNALESVKGKNFSQKIDDFEFEGETFSRSEIIVDIAATMELASLLFQYARLEQLDFNTDAYSLEDLWAILHIHGGIDLSNHPLSTTIMEELDHLSARTNKLGF